MQGLDGAEKDIAGEVMTSTHLWRNFLALCDRFGNRHPGSEGEQEAARFLVGQFEAYDLDDPHVEEFRFQGWQRGTATLQVVSPETRELPCISLVYTGTCDLEGQVVYLGHGTPADFYCHSQEVAGKIVMVSAWSPSYAVRRIHRAEKISRAAALGAKGLVWMRWEPGLLPETGSAAWNAAASMPCVAVAREHGEELIRLGRTAPVVVRITTRNRLIPGAVSQNVVAEIRGASHPEEIVVVGAHYDGHDICPGAIDDASGAAVVMEAARVLARHRHLMGRTVRFVCFGAEELGLIGSHAYVRAHEEELDSYRLMLNLDSAGSVGGSGGILVAGEHLELVRRLRLVASRMGERLVVDNALTESSDHFPFFLAGVPAASYLKIVPAQPGGTAGVRGWGHTAADTVDKVSPTDLRAAALLTARLVLHVASAPEWPVGRRSRDEVEESLERFGLLEVLKLQGRYPFTVRRDQGGSGPDASPCPV